MHVEKSPFGRLFLLEFLVTAPRLAITAPRGPFSAPQTGETAPRDEISSKSLLIYSNFLDILSEWNEILSVSPQILSKLHRILSKSHNLLSKHQNTPKKGNSREANCPFKPYYNAFTAAIMTMTQATINATPPIGVMAPRTPMPVKLNTYKLPEKMTIPASIK